MDGRSTIVSRHRDVLAVSTRLLSPGDERERLLALARYCVMDTPPEAVFDRLVRRAATACGAPMAVLAFVDIDRVWIKSRFGHDLGETPRDASFCASTVLGDDVFEVPDAAADPRFARSPQVVGEPKIRFFAGVPLRSREGYNIGALGVMDRVPRRLDAAQRSALSAAGVEVLRHLERSRRLRELARSDLLDPTEETVDHSPANTQPPVPASARLGRYTLLREIGRGSSATIYAAYDVELDRKVALKVLRTRSPRVRSEAQALARISHPNVVQIYEIGGHEGQEFIAMELIDGVSLRAWQEAETRDIYDVIDKYAQAAHGLAAAHGAGIIHRDFKPENVLVDRHGRARVADFGLARRVASDGDEGRALPGGVDLQATQASAILGTPAYMAPEQYLSPAVDERADQFSLCASLYEAVYGVRPFHGVTFSELRDNVLAGALQQPPDARAPAALRALLIRGLAPDPIDRWPSMAELADRLADLDSLRDPAAASRERRRFVRSLLLVCLSGLAVFGTFGSEAEILQPWRMAGVSGVLVVLALVGVALTRQTLLRNTFHRKMLSVVLVGVSSRFVTCIVAALAEIPVAQSFLVEQLVIGAVLLGAAALGPYFVAGCAVMWSAAMAVALGAPFLPVHTLASALVVLLFGLGWSRAADVRFVRSRGRGSGPSAPGSGSGGGPSSR